MKFHSPIYIAGQTGSGKTGVSIELARRLDSSAVIINADAFQIYRGIGILAATPTAEERAEIPHFLFEIFPVSQTCDAAHFSELARGEINRQSETAVPIVVGGSGLYLKAITHGFAPTPPGDEKIRARLDAKSLEELVAEYQKLDPVGAEKTNLKNRRYVSRNLEICLITGEPASEIKDHWEIESPQFNGIYLERDRADIYDRINRRTFQMFEQGVVAEISELTESASETAAKAIGWKEIQMLLREEISEEKCIANIQQITRRFAKRQETWFKREPQFQRVRCEPDDSSETIVDRILEIFPISELQSRKSELPCPESPKETPPESR